MDDGMGLDLDRAELTADVLERVMAAALRRGYRWLTAVEIARLAGKPVSTVRYTLASYERFTKLPKRGKVVPWMLTKPTLRQAGLNPKALGTNPKALGTNPKAMGTNPRALGTNPNVMAKVARLTKA